MGCCPKHDIVGALNLDQGFERQFIATSAGGLLGILRIQSIESFATGPAILTTIHPLLRNMSVHSPEA